MKSQRIVIVGAGDYGRTALEITRALNEKGSRFEVLGFLDDDAKKTSIAGIPVLGGLGWATKHPEVTYVLAVADPEAKRVIVDQLGKDATFVGLIHPRAMILDSVQVGRGVMVSAGALVVHDARLGDFVLVNLNATIGHDCVLEEFVTVSPGANIAGRVRVQAGGFIGLNATVLENLTIGGWATVGAGAVVLKDVPTEAVVFGNPARVVDRKVN